MIPQYQKNLLKAIIIDTMANMNKKKKKTIPGCSLFQCSMTAILKAGGDFIEKPFFFKAEHGKKIFF